MFEVATIKSKIVCEIWCPHCQHNHVYEWIADDEYGSISYDDVMKCKGCERWFATTEQYGEDNEENL